jgi:hypothetical protein
MSTVQAAYAALLLVYGRSRADHTFIRLMVAGGATTPWDAGAFAALLSNGGTAASVVTPPERDAARLYDRVKFTKHLMFGVWEPANSMGAVVWGLTYQKPCKCAGLCFFLGDRSRPHMATPHRNRYLGDAVEVAVPVIVDWVKLDGLPILG